MLTVDHLNPHPTPYPAINALLSRLLSDLQALLGDRLAGLYLHGSLALGDFNPGRSDVDFLAATRDDLPPEMLPELSALHSRIAASGLEWARKLEGSYLPLHALRRYDPLNAVHPALSAGGAFALDHHGPDWEILLHTLREHGLVLLGPAPQTLIDPIPAQRLKQAALGVLHAWWAPQLHDTSRLQASEYQAYAVLTMCRILYTIQYGTVVSKPTAARWAQHSLAPCWIPLIDQALAWRHGMQVEILPETLAIIRFTLQQCTLSPYL